ncbi:MAG: UDP-N-acetylglucosamine 2-epimerase (non-hydrolyzing) [Anaerolineales bacterium]
MTIKTIASIVGARPQFVKAAPLSRALATVFDEKLIHTGQHYDYGMSDVFFEQLGIAPHYNLGVGSGSHAGQTGGMMIALERLLDEMKPDLVLVYGDTNSTLAGALVAAKARIPLAHVEAGLRSYNRAMPEEINRVVADHLSDILFCPTDVAVQNLAKEGIRQNVHQVGDVMYDALLYNLAQARGRSTILADLDLQSGKYALVTVHRAANTDHPANMTAILTALGRLPTRIVFPLHPRTRKLLAHYGLSAPPNVSLLEPVGYFDMLILEENADCILTDSGGMQKEAYLLGVRCITLRDETEWVETVQAGWNTLAGARSEAIQDAYENWRPRGERPALYGDGHAAEKICTVLREWKFSSKQSGSV